MKAVNNVDFLLLCFSTSPI